MVLLLRGVQEGADTAADADDLEIEIHAHKANAHIVKEIHSPVPPSPPHHERAAPPESPAIQKAKAQKTKKKPAPLKTVSLTPKAEAVPARKRDVAPPPPLAPVTFVSADKAPGLDQIFKNGYDGRVVGTGGFVGQAAM